MSRCVAGLIHPGILKEINMDLLGKSVYVITLVYLCVTFRTLYVYYLFVWCSRLGLMRFPTSQSSATWSIHNPTLPCLVFNYMLWNDSFWMMRLWLNIFLCSKLCYSYCKWQFFPYIFTINFILCSSCSLIYSSKIVAFVTLYFIPSTKNVTENKHQHKNEENKSHITIAKMQSNRKPPYV
jgi:hypothetical protein